MSVTDLLLSDVSDLHLTSPLRNLLKRRRSQPHQLPARYQTNLKPIPAAIQVDYLDAIESEERAMRRTFAQEAKVKLGYTALANHLAPPGTLQQTLADLHIPTLRTEAVEKYKHDEVVRVALTVMSTRGVWDTTQIAYFDGYVPEGALQMAMDIHDRIPQADFIVHHLRVDRRDEDPFLEVRYAGERFYIAWWDEPQFKP